MQGRIWQAVAEFVKKGLQTRTRCGIMALTLTGFLLGLEDAMKLSLEQLSSIARGVDRVEVTSDGVQFFRMTEAQKGYYMHYNNIEKANKTDST